MFFNIKIPYVVPIVRLFVQIVVKNVNQIWFGQQHNPLGYAELQIYHSLAYNRVQVYVS